MSESIVKPETEDPRSDSIDGLSKYQSIKVVKAARIDRIVPSDTDPNIPILHLTDMETGLNYTHVVSNQWLKMRGAEEGGVFVMYSDSYTSYSPMKTFLAGNVSLSKDATGPFQFSAMSLLTSTLNSDDEYAWGWLCNLAMAALDTESSLSPEQANRIAYRQMKHFFRIDMADLIKERLGFSF